MKKTTIFGPPGTGKTTFLMGLLDDALKHKEATDIAFASFTRQGTYEGVSRAVDKFELKKTDTKFFRTIHSLCFANLGLSKTNMVGKKHYKLLSEKTGINFTGFYTQDFISANDAYLHYLSMNKHNPAFAEKLLPSLNSAKLKYIDIQYNEMKKQLGIIDFDDMLELYLNEGSVLPVKTAFIDEAQDLTPLQWKVVKKMFSEVETIYVAGDDDQAVYEWSGADVTQFLDFSDKSIVLDQSYRLPANVHALAMKISNDIGRRKKKAFKPTDEEGSLNAVNSIQDIDYNGGELVLARTNWLLKSQAERFSSLGIPYIIKGRNSIDKTTLKAIKTHIDFEKGLIPVSELQKYSTFFKTINFDSWQNTINLPQFVVTHYDQAISKGNLCMEPVKFETFHSCKGSENDHVIISPEITANLHKKIFKQYDAELRCLYVGMTRTKRNLTVIIPETKRFYPSKYFSS